jgi:myo-inositol-1(or 4)-monophosphatase
VTFAIDAEAERELEAFLAERAPELAFYSEDRGLVEPPGGASAVLVVDPIDGTRPALAGLESCCVSVAAATMDGEPSMADVAVGCVVEIPSGQVFLAERGAGVVEGPPIRLSPNERLERMFWTYGFRGRPARPLVEVIGDLIDASSVGGATFELGSAAFDMTRIVTGQLDAYVEPGPRLVDELAGMRAEFERVGKGAVLNNSPYDLAAATLILEEAGAVVTDAYGRSLSGCPLLGSGHDFQMSVVASGNAALHGQIVRAIDASFARVSG